MSKDIKTIRIRLFKYSCFYAKLIQSTLNSFDQYVKENPKKVTNRQLKHAQQTKNVHDKLMKYSKDCYKQDSDKLITLKATDVYTISMCLTNYLVYVKTRNLGFNLKKCKMIAGATTLNVKMLRQVAPTGEMSKYGKYFNLDNTYRRVLQSLKKANHLN